MKIQFCSDLHLEFKDNNEYLKQNPIQAIGDILILAGDITYLGEKYFENRFFDNVSAKFQNVFWLPGNHEYYSGEDTVNIHLPMWREIRQNVFLINNETFEYKGVKFIFSTLWTRLVYNLLPIKMILADFKRIKHQGKLIDIEDYNHFHKTSLDFLKNAFDTTQHPKIVTVTHHIPTKSLVADEFKDSAINDAFNVELEKEIEIWQPNFWIYGHSHRNLSPYEIGKTKILTNQLGYVSSNEHNNFNHQLFFEI